MGVIVVAINFIVSHVFVSVEITIDWRTKAYHQTAGTSHIPSVLCKRRLSNSSGKKKEWRADR